MRLYIVRHAWAYERDVNRWPDDGQRPLTAEGRARFAKVAKALAQRGFDPTAIATSPLIRCRETADLLLARLPRSTQLAELTARATKQPGFSERLWLDVYRLRFAAGLLKQADEFADMAGLALQAGYPAEAMRVIDKGYALGLLGNGKDAAAHGQLRERTEKAAEKDSADMSGSERSARASREGDALVNLGFAVVSGGQVTRGLPLIEAGLAKGNLRRADEARLHHGIALWISGKREEAVRAFGEVKGADGSAALARIWSLFARSSAGRS